MRIPPVFRCPVCQPGVISYAGTVISRVCGTCKRAMENDRLSEDAARKAVEGR